MLVFADGACHHLIFPASHELVLIFIGSLAESGIFETLEAASVAGEISGMENQVFIAEKLLFEPIKLWLYDLVSISLIYDDSPRTNTGY